MALRFLHLHSSFHPGGKELRAAKLMTAFGKGLEHTVVSAEPGALGAASAVGKGIVAHYPDDFPPLAGKPLPRRLMKLAEAMRGFDLILTYNWGAMDAALAHTCFVEHMGLAPLVHHEDGFNHDEVHGLKWQRNLFRRVALFRASALVVPSRQLEAIALDVWKQPRGRVQRVVNGIDTAAYARQPRRDALPRLIKREGELWLGTLAGLRPVKALPRLVRAFASLPEPWQLVILGEGPERAAILAEANRLGLAHRVHLPGHAPDPAKAVGLFDLFALSSDSEQCPVSVVEAMAAGLAIAAPDVGDVAAMVAPENAGFIAPVGDEAALAASLQALADDPALRKQVGEANRARARTEFDEAMMVARYRAIYARAMGREAF